MGDKGGERSAQRGPLVANLGWGCVGRSPAGDSDAGGQRIGPAQSVGEDSEGTRRAMRETERRTAFKLHGE